MGRRASSPSTPSGRPPDPSGPRRRRSWPPTGARGRACRRSAPRRGAPDATLDAWRAADDAVQARLRRRRSRDELTEPSLARPSQRRAPATTSRSSCRARCRCATSSGSARAAARRRVSSPTAAPTASTASSRRRSASRAGATRRRARSATSRSCTTRARSPTGSASAAGRCVLVVADNRGGGIFSFLPQRARSTPRDFERLFATPPRVDVAVGRGGLRLRRARGEGPRRRSRTALDAGLATDGRAPSSSRGRRIATRNVELHRELAERPRRGARRARPLTVAARSSARTSSVLIASVRTTVLHGSPLARGALRVRRGAALVLLAVRAAAGPGLRRVPRWRDGRPGRRARRAPRHVSRARRAARSRSSSGFSFVYVSLGTVFGGLGQALHAHQRTLVDRASASVTIVLGLFFAGWLPSARRSSTARCASTGSRARPSAAR